MKEEAKQEEKKDMEEEKSDLAVLTSRYYKKDANKKIMNMCKYYAHVHKCKFEL